MAESCGVRVRSTALRGLGDPGVNGATSNVECDPRGRTARQVGGLGSGRLRRPTVREPPRYLSYGQEEARLSRALAYVLGVCGLEDRRREVGFRATAHEVPDKTVLNQNVDV